jgi:hypothetical protein
MAETARSRPSALARNSASSAALSTSAGVIAPVEQRRQRVMQRLGLKQRLRGAIALGDVAEHRMDEVVLDGNGHPEVPNDTIAAGHMNLPYR